MATQESFDPIMDLSTNTDLLPLMIYARQYGEWDYKNCHVMLLRHKVRCARCATGPGAGASGQGVTGGVVQGALGYAVGRSWGE